MSYRKQKEATEASEAPEPGELLKEWESFIDKVRLFFKERRYREVFTPVLNPYPNLDSNVEPIPVNLKVHGKVKRLWLHTSPEYSMKKLLSRTRVDMFQIAKVFRDNELSKVHRPEFFMLEWYKIGKDFNYLMDEIEDLLNGLLEVKGVLRITMAEAFKEFLGIELRQSREKLYLEMKSKGYDVKGTDNWESLFFRAFIELERCITEPTFITHFPKRLSALAKIRGDTAERFELFIKGVELANGWTEETSPAEIKKRLWKEAVSRGLPLDEGFINIHETLPPCAGCSMGLERLFMLQMGFNSLDFIDSIFGFQALE